MSNGKTVDIILKPRLENIKWSNNASLEARGMFDPSVKTRDVGRRYIPVERFYYFILLSVVLT